MIVHRTALALSATPLVLLAACGGASGVVSGVVSGGNSAGSDAELPAGVVDQYSTLEAEVGDRGGQTTSGEWNIAYIVEAAEPWFESHEGHTRFRKPTSAETHHIEIIPTEKASGRIIPDVPITVEVIDAGGQVVDEKTLNFYYSTFFHYANNFSIPVDGQYTLRATLASPTFLRHGEETEGPALSEGATVTFEGVEISKG